MHQVGAICSLEGCSKIAVGKRSAAHGIRAKTDPILKGNAVN